MPLHSKLTSYTLKGAGGASCADRNVFEGFTKKWSLYLFNVHIYIEKNVFVAAEGWKPSFYELL